jgi:transposase
VEDITEETAELVARVAALDIGKAELTACVRVPHEDKPGRRRQEVRTFATVTRSLLELRDWLICQGVTLCVMEATSTYWKPPFYLLEDAIECWVVNARDVKNVPGRPKTGWMRSGWPSWPSGGCCARRSSRRRGSGSCGICAATGATWSRSGPGKSSGPRSCWKTQIKLSMVASDIFGASGRAMMAALIAGET